MQTVHSWKLLDLTTPPGFGGCRRPGTVYNENKGRRGERMGRLKEAQGRRQRASAQEPRASPPDSPGTGCDLTRAQASLPLTPRPPKSQSGPEPAWPDPGRRLECVGLAPHVRVRRASIRRPSGRRGREPGAPGTGRRQTPPAGLLLKEMWLSSVPKGGRQPGREQGRPQRGRARPRGNGEPEAVPFPSRPASSSPPPSPAQRVRPRFSPRPPLDVTGLLRRRTRRSGESG